ncbi:hypothetical protein HTZ84_16975 [Haloterrigena sp. SYSU A558-1]|uniref:DUF8151 domain-containing protein n=1 Tax=Haloterrigena gelatinilytica TaxID=2741724 RepID=A0A8J8KAG2_9EURY|nr:hypothetical protein [Haloterrigena gelatinilytica]NUB90205.1 hypothetical protein [Haloterrigena gelatinilytica]NUC73974.1 hypothetical protein [Haloterrigena gelatinilytica]
MGTAIPELLAELLPMVAYTIAAGVLTVIGFAAEYASMQHIGAGETTVAFWLAAIGCVMLYAGVYGLGYQKVLARAFGIEQ